MPLRWSRSSALALIPLSVAFTTVLAAPCAGATDCTGANGTNVIASTCINDDTLWPHAGASRFVGFGGAETVAAGQVGFGILATYLSRPIVLHVPGPQGDQYAINDQVNG